MLYLYHGGGASDIFFGKEPLAPNEWQQIRKSAVRLLLTRGFEKAANTLDSIPFQLYDATNGFGDEFRVLCASLKFEQYVDCLDQYAIPETKVAYRHIADTISELGSYIRFVVAQLDVDEPPMVTTPTLGITSEVVERALTDAEHLIAKQGAVSAIDRVHTAFHGYLRTSAKQMNIEAPDDASVTSLFKLIRKAHPGLQTNNPRSNDIQRILQAMATIIDATSTIRNRASIAHPNDALIEEPEARLIVNVIRSLLYYLDAKIGKA